MEIVPFPSGSVQLNHPSRLHLGSTQNLPLESHAGDDAGWRWIDLPVSLPDRREEEHHAYPGRS